MNVLVVINPAAQDMSLGIAFDGAMKIKGWGTKDSIPYCYTKAFKQATNQEITTATKNDVAYSVDEAEWEKLNYLILISDQHPATFITK